VDINPNAVEIARLRLWIELLRSAYYKEDGTMETLPNIDINIVVGDSLACIPGATSGSFAGIDVPQLVEKMKEYQNASDKSVKEELKKDIVELQGNIRKFAGCQEFIWETTFPYILESTGNKQGSSEEFVFKGFDVVLGNPPYIQLRKDRGKLANKYECKKMKVTNNNQCYTVFARIGDIYELFIEQGYNLLNKENGTLAFITSNKWLKAGHGKKLRQFLLEKTNLDLIIDFGEYYVFPNATVYTSILMFSAHRKENNSLYAVNIDEQKYKEYFKKGFSNPLLEYVNDNRFQMRYSDLSLSGFTLGDVDILNLKRKIEENGKPLKDLKDLKGWNININFGINTGFKEAFIIDTKTRNKILADCKTEEERKRTKEIIKHVLRGRDIKKYYYKWAGKWIIGTFPALNLNIDNYPALKKYLSSFGDRLNQDGKAGHRKKTYSKWFETQDSIAYYPEFAKKKIVWQTISKEPSFAYDRKKFFISPSAYIATGYNLKYILALLNSKVAYFYLEQIASSVADKTNLWMKQYVELIPIPLINSKNRILARLIRKKVDNILKLTKSVDYEKDKEKQNEVARLENEIDELVYQIYGLNQNEIQIIKNAVEK
jgi:hypothetical protein